MSCVNSEESPHLFKPQSSGKRALEFLELWAGFLNSNKHQILKLYTDISRWEMEALKSGTWSVQVTCRSTE